MSKSPIIATVGKMEIREHNVISISLSGDELIKLAKIAQETKLSVSKIIALMGRECQQCGCNNITITIPKNVISGKKQASGNSQFYTQVNKPEDGQ